MLKYLWLILTLITISCTPYVNGVCRHNAMYNALVLGDVAHKKVRIAWGPTSFKGINHAQAQAFVDGEWRWLCFDGAEPDFCNQDNFEIIKYYTPKEFYNHFFGYLH